MTLLRLPFMPIYYNGETKLMPIHVTDCCIIIKTIQSKDNDFVIECIGPETFTFKEIIQNY